MNKEVEVDGLAAVVWLLWSGLVVLYLVLLFTVCAMTFRKGHIVLGVIGIFLPILWLVGAALPPTEASSYAAESPH